MSSCNLLALAASAAFAGTVRAEDRPNVVFIFSDDHAYQAISAYGEARRLVETPNIDRIAAGGMRFDRCLVPNSICGPSRATVLTGTYSHKNGFYNNTNSRFDGSQDTFPKRFQAAGYQTAMIGKWHLVTDPTGFDEWHILPGQGAYYNPPMIRNGAKVEHQGYVTDLIAELSIEWLKERDPKKPFLLMMQHKAPHREWEPAPRHLGHDGDRIYPEPPTLFDDYAGRGLAERDQDMTIERTMTDRDLKLVAPARLDSEQLSRWNAYYEPRNAAFRAAALEGRELVRWKYNRYMHDYLGCIKGVDEAVGRVLDELDVQGLSGNTIVVYASDQGFYLGEHGWFDKRWIFEESLRTPLLVRWPGHVQAGSTSAAIVSNLDFAATLLDAAGLDPLPAQQGKSFVPILEGRTPGDWRHSFYYHYYEYPVPHRVRPHYGVVTDRYKLVRFDRPDVDAWELFDLEADPLELRDVADEPANAAVVAELRAELSRLRAELEIPEDAPKEAYGQLNNDPKPEAQWKPLFNGKDLKGWVQRGGKANYRVEGGEIVGASVPNTPNSFLCTDRDFGDFELELEFKVDADLNSGIQVRSQCFDEAKRLTFGDRTIDIPAGRVHGYQVEIDPSERAWTGGVYDESRRGWLDDLADNEPARQAFKPGEWNHFRIACRGNSIKTYLNGVAAADLRDEATASGFIALQVHGVGEITEPLEVHWRDLQIRELH